MGNNLKFTRSKIIHNRLIREIVSPSDCILFQPNYIAMEGVEDSRACRLTGTVGDADFGSIFFSKCPETVLLTCSRCSCRRKISFWPGKIIKKKTNIYIRKTRRPRTNNGRVKRYYYYFVRTPPFRFMIAFGNFCPATGRLNSSNFRGKNWSVTRTRTR